MHLQAGGSPAMGRGTFNVPLNKYSCSAAHIAEGWSDCTCPALRHMGKANPQQPAGKGEMQHLKHWVSGHHDLPLQRKPPQNTKSAHEPPRQPQAHQSVAVADGHDGAGHVRDVPGEKAPLLEGFPEKHLKILLPFGHGAQWHQPPVGPQPEVQLLPKNRDVEVEQAAASPTGLRGLIQGAAGDTAVRRTWGWGTRGFADPRRRVAGHHVRDEATPAISAEGDDHTILAEFAGQEQLCRDKTERKSWVTGTEHPEILVAKAAFGEPHRPLHKPNNSFSLSTLLCFVVLTGRLKRSRINSG